MVQPSFDIGLAQIWLVHSKVWHQKKLGIDNIILYKFVFFLRELNAAVKLEHFISVT